MVSATRSMRTLVALSACSAVHAFVTSNRPPSARVFVPARPYFTLTKSHAHAPLSLLQASPSKIVIDNAATQSKTKRQIATKLIKKAAFAFGSLTLLQMTTTMPAAAAAAAASTSEGLHLGQKIANFIRTFGIPDVGVLAIISALPVVELRGAIPVGIWMNLPLTTVLPVCIIGNMIPILPLLLLLKNDALKKAMKPILDRAEKKTSELGMGSMEKQWISLAAFVGIPLPGTGAWTGAMGAFLLDMPLFVALTSIFAGVVSAGAIMTAITLAGAKGGLAALAVLILATATNLFKKEEETSTSSESSDV